MTELREIDVNKFIGYNFKCPTCKKTVDILLGTPHEGGTLICGICGSSFIVKKIDEE
jgi:transcription elongation factor Elf1